MFDESPKRKMRQRASMPDFASVLRASKMPRTQSFHQAMDDAAAAPNDSFLGPHLRPVLTPRPMLTGFSVCTPLMTPDLRGLTIAAPKAGSLESELSASTAEALMAAHGPFFFPSPPLDIPAREQREIIETTERTTAAHSRSISSTTFSPSATLDLSSNDRA